MSIQEKIRAAYLKAEELEKQLNDIKRQDAEETHYRTSELSKKIDIIKNEIYEKYRILRGSITKELDRIYDSMSWDLKHCPHKNENGVSAVIVTTPMFDNESTAQCTICKKKWIEN